MKLISTRFIFVFLVSLTSFILFTCPASGFPIEFSQPANFDSPAITLVLTPILPSISSTPRIFTPTPSRTLTATQRSSSTSTASITPTPSVTSSLTPSQTYTFTFTLTRLPSLTASASLTVYHLASSTPPNTWTPVLPENTSTGTATPSRTVPSGTFTPGSTLSPTSFGFTPSFTSIVSPITTVLPSPTTSGCNITYNDSYESQVVSLVNGQRADASPSLPALTINSSLMISARGHSVDMALNNYMSHTGSDGSTPWQRMLQAGYAGRWGGENIWVGYSSGTPQDAMTWWMNDAPHRDNILGQYYQDIGVGFAYCPTGTYRYIYTIDFGVP